MAVHIPPESAEAKERCKWEAQFTPFGAPGRPYVFRAYPMYLFKAGRIDGVTPGIVEERIADDEQAAANLKSRGFCEDPEAALAAFHASDLEIAKLAAERHYTERRMTAHAQAEGAAADAASGSHVPSVPETPIKKRGRPVKPVVGKES